MEGPTQNRNRYTGDANGGVTVAASLTVDRFGAPFEQNDSHLKAVETLSPAMDGQEGAYLPAALMNRMAAVYYADRDDNFSIAMMRPMTSPRTPFRNSATGSGSRRLIRVSPTN